jgi:hypothetical protein
MKSIFKNWKTTAAGIAIIIIKLFTAKGKIDAETGTAIAAGIGLIVASDHNKETGNNGQ